MIKKIRVRGYRIHRDLTIYPNRKLNLIVGANESGKSTLMESIVLALTGRINGRSAAEELNPHWFNTGVVADFIAKRKRGEPQRFPEIDIEVFLENVPELQELCGAHNSDTPTNACPGVRFRCIPNQDYLAELQAWAKAPSSLLPIEWYRVEWRTFADRELIMRPRVLATAVIDARTVRSTSGVDYHLRQILGSQLEHHERANISRQYRDYKAVLSDTAFKSVNERIGKLHSTLHEQPISLAMDQTTRTSWEESVAPHVDGVPFAMAGQGQQSAIKIALAMNKHAGRAKFVMIEEPENHLSHTSLTRLLHRMETLTSDDQQLFITTHSSSVLNRLGLEALQFLGPTAPVKLNELDPETVRYFKKLPGFDTLRIVLADRIVLVEGPSDEIVFERVFKDLHGKRPMECGIDVLSMRGLSLGRGLELCERLGKKVAALRDNDGIESEELRKPLAQWLKPGSREVFIGEVAHGRTLEPQMIHHCGEAQLRTILGITDKADVGTWMSREKTEAALRIASSSEQFTPPAYMLQAAQFIHG
ncbi:ATP-dependent nuclease [Noviherbaspirillum denitrificans]|uniref:ATP-dependent endonuclease n=1 Tax=Noviherbaspirillum denitrificans TaxID=1968433 RepID=A0A254TDN1_9BURK|nr:AAA family ATPase [Noviherbaspirillum denitrificans]OWW18064.1 ATP-dependent endonuclease [Noviherbaspirillum denitrificans]OWW20655.1 ATP-dependent endonuclease [Noviherbaspirillum denitrificans]